jgi:polysaccharide pyruvyl transferase WcaK-like protein
MFLRLLVLASAFSLPHHSWSSESTETERLARVTEQQARCAAVAVGNFPTDKKTQEAVAHLYQAMLKNVRRMIAAERTRGSKKIEAFSDILEPDVFAGYMLRAFADGDEKFRRERDALREARDFDWRSVNKELWAKHGCDAVIAAARME